MEWKEDIKYKWKEYYSYVIPSIITLSYVVYIFLIEKEKINASPLQSSSNFDKMLEALIGYMSITLSVFGFLIPSFLSGKGETKAINYFLKYADMKVFASKLKNVVAVGLVAVFIASILLLTDIIPQTIMNAAIIIWLWLLFHFMCNSYRFICIMINLLMVQKEEFVQKAENEISEEDKKDLKQKIKRI